MKNIIEKIKQYCINNGRILRVINGQQKTIFHRFCFFKRDEYWAEHKLINQLPWWLPFNMFIHEWELDLIDGDKFHSHPRWSITIVLKGEIHEVTPRYNRVLKAGHMVFRTHKSRHKFFTSKMNKEKCVTLFIVGRRKFTQYEYDDCGNILGIIDGAQNFIKEKSNEKE